MRENKKNILQVAHITETPGPVQFLAEYLGNKASNFYQIYHSLDTREKSNSVFVKNNKTLVGSEPSNYVSNFFRTISWLGKIKEPIDLAIGMNCFDTLPLILLRKKTRIKKVVFFAVDFSRKRFDNFFLNRLYIFIDKFCACRADFVCCNTQRAIDQRIKEGVGKDKIIHTPNGVFRKDIGEIRAERKNFSRELLYIGNLSLEHGLDDIVDILGGFDNLILEIIGSGEYEKKLKERINRRGLAGRVKFLGRKSHEEVIEYLKNFSGFGIAPYKIKSDWTWYCDPVKVKEYLACRVPVIISDVPEVAEEIKAKNLGFVYRDINELKNILKMISMMDRKEYEKFLLQIESDKNNYDLETVYDRVFEML